jgi:hypothetical protein
MRIEQGHKGNTRSRTHPYEKLKKMMYVCNVRRTNSTFPDSNTAKILDSGSNRLSGLSWGLLVPVIRQLPFSKRMVIKKKE